MPVDVLTEITIARSANAGRGVRRRPGQRPGLVSRTSPRSVGETEPPLRTGSRLAFTARFHGRPLAYTYEITESVPAERLVMRTA